MSSEERNVWVSLMTTPAVAIVYFAVIAARAQSAPVSEISWVAPMAWALGGLIAVTVVVTILAAVATEVASEVRAEIRNRLDPSGAGKDRGRRNTDADERDRRIDRHGDYWSLRVVFLGVLAAVIVTMLGLDHFWIAHVLFLTIVLTSICAGVVKIVAYRWGF